MKRIYLAGPINGKSDDECNAWRQRAIQRMTHFECIDPMTRDYRGNEDHCVQQIVHGDLCDVASCDGVLVNASAPSWGTAMEIVYAKVLDKKIVAICSGSVSPWLSYHATIATTEHDAYRALSMLLLGDGE